MLQLPDIADAARNRPLSYDPRAGAFIYYDDVARGTTKIFPLDKLSEEDLVRLAVARYEQNGDGGGTGVFNGRTLSREDVEAELWSGTKLGRQLVQMDIDYLRFYLESFPQEAFGE